MAFRNRLRQIVCFENTKPRHWQVPGFGLWKECCYNRCYIPKADFSFLAVNACASFACGTTAAMP